MANSYSLGIPPALRYNLVLAAQACVSLSKGVQKMEEYSFDELLEDLSIGREVSLYLQN